MRLARPKTLLNLILVALGLVCLPLLVGVANAVYRLDQLMDESAAVANLFAASTRETQRITQDLTNTQRLARQYLVDHSEERLGLYRDAADDLTSSLTEISNIERPADVETDLQLIRDKAADVDAIVVDSTDDSVDDDVVALFAEMTSAANRIVNNMREFSDEQLRELRNNTLQTQRTLAWQAAALIPGTLILVLFFWLLIGKPMRQIDRAIRELGSGDFDNEITVSGPSDLEKLGHQLEWLRLRLAESSEEKNKFLRHMSHELKTPLANIREGTELLLDGSVGRLDRQQEEVTSILRENGIKLQRLIENLLTFSAWQARTAALDITEFELKELVFGTLSQHRLVISSRRIRLELEIEPIRIAADEVKLRLVFENLLSNAIKCTPEKGTIGLRAHMDKGELIIDIADSGPGIAPEDRDRIFEAFYQGRLPQGGPVGGTGIGLSVVHECVQAHGGAIRLLPDGESRYGGANFIVRLPMRRASDKPQLAVANG